MPKSSKHVIAVVSGKGGVGKSTLAVNIASILSQQGVPTILLDADFYNPCVFFHLGITPHSSGLQELLEGKARIEDTMSIHPATGLRCVSASLEVYPDVRTRNLQKVIDMLDYDYIVIDCAPGFSDMVKDVISVSSEIFLLMTPDIPSVTAAMKLISAIDHEHRVHNVHCILNRVSNQPYELHPREIEDICKGTDSPFTCRLAAIVPEDPSIPKSIASKSPVAVSSPNSPASRVFQSLARTLLLNNHATSKTKTVPLADSSISPAPASESPGLLGRFLGWIRGFFK